MWEEGEKVQDEKKRTWVANQPLELGTWMTFFLCRPGSFKGPLPPSKPLSQPRFEANVALWQVWQAHGAETFGIQLSCLPGTTPSAQDRLVSHEIIRWQVTETTASCLSVGGRDSVGGQERGVLALTRGLLPPPSPHVIFSFQVPGESDPA